MRQDNNLDSLKSTSEILSFKYWDNSMLLSTNVDSVQVSVYWRPSICYKVNSLSSYQYVESQVEYKCYTVNSLQKNVKKELNSCKSEIRTCKKKYKHNSRITSNDKLFGDKWCMFVNDDFYIVSINRKCFEVFVNCHICYVIALSILSWQFDRRRHLVTKLVDRQYISTFYVKVYSDTFTMFTSFERLDTW